MSSVRGNYVNRADAAAGDPPEMDRQLVEDTRRQIREIVNEIAVLARGDVPLSQFCSDYLSRVVSALACHGGAIWLIDDESQLQLQHEIAPAEPLSAGDQPRDPRHRLLLEQIAARRESVLAAPRSSASGDEEVGNPTDYLLIVGVVEVEGRARALVELFQRAGGGPTTHRGYLRFVLQMCGHFADYLKSHQLRSYSEREALWDSLEAFTRAAHQSLDVQETAYTIVNQGRGLIGCDRLSVAQPRGKRPRLAAISGVESFDRRSAEVKLLEDLAAVVAASRQPLWYAGDDSHLPPQIAEALDRYVDHSQVRSLAIVPLVPEEDPEGSQSDTGGRQGRLAGLLIGEQYRQSAIDKPWQHRMTTVARHSATALANAQAHSSIVLMPLWQTLARQRWLLTFGGVSKTAAAVVLAAALLAAALLLPADFEMASSGRLQPSLRREVFAGIEGNVTEVMVAHGQQVEAGQVLLRMSNTDLQVEIENLRGRQAATAEEIASIGRGLLDTANLSLVEQHRMNGRLRQLAESQIAVQRELELVEQKRQRLTVRSPIQGMVVTWDAQEQLAQRPVAQGERLLTVVDPRSRWELELEIPEKRLGHVKQARRDQRPDLRVTFSLGTHPGSTFEGRMVSLRETAEPDGPRQGNVVARVAIESADLPELHPGATASAKIDCGQRSLAYVWLHDAWETIRTQVWLWF